MSGARTFRCAIALIALTTASVSSVSAMQCCLGDFPLTAELESVIQEQFAAVPALGIVAALPDAICSTVRIASPAELLAGIAATCSVAVSCRAGDYFSFQLSEDGQVLAPKGLGRLLAEQCPESISDPRMRETLVNEYEDELQRLGAWLHEGLAQ